MKKVYLSTAFLLTISFGFAVNNVEKATIDNLVLHPNAVTETESTSLPNDDCGGCIAWADSRDDGSDRTLIKWRRDLASCRANSPDCNDNNEPVLTQ